MATLGWMWILLLIITILLTVSYFIGTRTYNHFTKQNAPFIPPLPFVGSMGRVILRKTYFPQIILDNYNKLRDHPYGGIFIFQYPVVMLRDPELIRTITAKDFEYFTDHRLILSKDWDPVFTRGLFSLKGQRWREMRSTLSPAFTSSKMKTMFVLVSQCCQHLVQFLEDCYEHAPQTGCKIQKDGELLILELKDIYTRYANDVIATTAFGIGVNSLKQPTNEFYMMGQELVNISGIRILKLLGFLTMPTIMKLLRIHLLSWKIMNFFRSLVLKTIATRREEGIVRPDMLQLLMQAQEGTLQEEGSTDSNKNAKITQFKDEDIIAQVILFFLAGFDTTSTLLCFASYLLATHPDVQSRLQDEIDETLQECGGRLTYEVLHSMKYLNMVVSEILRMYPPGAALERICVKKYTIKSDPPFEVHPGESVLIPVFGLHRDPQYFPDPERFDPERFSDDNKHNINPLAYLPFGAGPRSCIGSRFALMETKLALLHLLSRFSLKVVQKTPISIKVIQRGLNMSIEGGFWLGLQPRYT